MTRFFFDFPGLPEDQVGTEFPTLDAALQEAAQALARHTAETVRSGEDKVELRVAIRDTHEEVGGVSVELNFERFR